MGKTLDYCTILLLFRRLNHSVSPDFLSSLPSGQIMPQERYIERYGTSITVSPIKEANYPNRSFNSNTIWINPTKETIKNLEKKE